MVCAEPKEWEGFEQDFDKPLQRIAMECFKKYSQVKKIGKYFH